MSDLEPLQTLVEDQSGQEIPLPPDLAGLYGSLRFPIHPGSPYIISNFVTTLDGVITLNIPGKSGGGEISGFNEHDRMVMGLLRAVSDAVVIGAGTLQAASQKLWTPESIYPALAERYQALRANLGKPEHPLNVVVTGSGQIDPSLPIFQSGQVSTLIVTTVDGWHRLREHSLPPTVQIAAIKSDGEMTARAIISAVKDVACGDLILIEGGAHLLGDFFAGECLNELFLTLAPQVAGRDDPMQRLALVADRVFAPDQPRWGTLISLKRASSHLFLRYSFESDGG